MKKTSPDGNFSACKHRIIRYSIPVLRLPLQPWFNPKAKNSYNNHHGVIKTRLCDRFFDCFQYSLLNIFTTDTVQSNTKTQLGKYFLLVSRVGLTNIKLPASNILIHRWNVNTKSSFFILILLSFILTFHDSITIINLAA